MFIKWNKTVLAIMLTTAITVDQVSAAMPVRSEYTFHSQIEMVGRSSFAEQSIPGVCLVA